MQRHRWVAAERNTLLLVRPVIAKVPGLAAGGRDGEGQPIQVGQGVCLTGGFGLTDGEIRKCHVHAPIRESCSSPSTSLTINYASSVLPVFFGLKFGLKWVGCGWISADRPGTSPRENSS